MKRGWSVGIVSAFLLIGCGILNNKEQARFNIIERLLKTACRIEWQDLNGNSVSGGSGTCIGTQTEPNGEISAYIITAAHITRSPEQSFRVAKIDLSEISPTVTMEERNRELTLVVITWEYNENGRSGNVHTYQAQEIWKSNRVDASIVKITAPYVALNVASIMPISDSGSLRIGERVIRTGCPFLGPPFLVRGSISRFDLYSYDWFDINTAAGDSGSGIFLEDSMQLVAITSVKQNGVCYICGAVPLKVVLEELIETELGFLTPTE